jgi:hypothetical protein
MFLSLKAYFLEKKFWTILFLTTKIKCSVIKFTLLYDSDNFFKPVTKSESGEQSTVNAARVSAGPSNTNTMEANTLTVEQNSGQVLTVRK